jgi:hypothetical protein
MVPRGTRIEVRMVPTNPVEAGNTYVLPDWGGPDGSGNAGWPIVRKAVDVRRPYVVGRL